MFFIYNNYFGYDQNIVDGLLLIASVLMVYIGSVDKNQVEYVNEIKQYYRDYYQTNIRQVIEKFSDQDVAELSPIFELDNKAGYILIEEPIFRKLVVPKVMNFFASFTHSRQHTTHFDAVMGLLGLIIVSCGFLYVSTCFCVDLSSYFKYVLDMIGTFLLVVIVAIVYYSYKAHAQRSRFKAFKDECDEMGMVIQNSMFLS